MENEDGRANPEGRRAEQRKRPDRLEAVQHLEREVTVRGDLDEQPALRARTGHGLLEDAAQDRRGFGNLAQHAAQGLDQ